MTIGELLGKKDATIISLSGDRTVFDVIYDFEEIGLKTTICYINLEYGDVCEYWMQNAADKSIAKFNAECECCECPAYYIHLEGSI